MRYRTLVVGTVLAGLVGFGAPLTADARGGHGRGWGGGADAPHARVERSHARRHFDGPRVRHYDHRGYDNRDHGYRAYRDRRGEHAANWLRPPWTWGH